MNLFGPSGASAASFQSVSCFNGALPRRQWGEEEGLIRASSWSDRRTTLHASSATLPCFWQREILSTRCQVSCRGRGWVHSTTAVMSPEPNHPQTPRAHCPLVLFSHLVNWSSDHILLLFSPRREAALFCATTGSKIKAPRSLVGKHSDRLFTHTHRHRVVLVSQSGTFTAVWCRLGSFLSCACRWQLGGAQVLRYGS